MPLGKLQEDLRVDQGLPLKAAKRLLLALALAAACLGGRTETPDEWVARGHERSAPLSPSASRLASIRSNVSMPSRANSPFSTMTVTRRHAPVSPVG